MTDTIKPIALPVLRDYAVIDGLSVRLTCGQLERKSYEAVNEALERAGGKWNKKARAHLFDNDPTAILEDIINTGNLPPKNPYAYFPTPATIVAEMVAQVKIENDMQVLEPSGGDGAICDGIRAVAPDASLTVIEIDPARAAKLRAKGYAVHEWDFLTFRPLGSYDAILMNPPFAVAGDPLAYITHIQHAHTMLAPWGHLVAIAPPSFTYRTDRRSQGFLAQVEAFGGWKMLPSESFKESSTGVSTVMLWLNAAK